MSATPKIKRVATRVYKVYGASGRACGWVEPSYLRLCPWRVSMDGSAPQDYRYIRDAKAEATARALRY